MITGTSISTDLLLPDLLSAALRGLSFIALLQAAGAAIFLAVFGRSLEKSAGAVARVARVAALAALVLLPLQFCLEAARMTGNLAGVLDLQMQRFALGTPGARVLLLRLAGLVLILTSLSHPAGFHRIVGAAGALAIGASFAMIGHTTTADIRWLLAPLVVAHVLIASFWFGALWPLVCVATSEPVPVSSRLIAKFSRIASALVPLILIAGLVIGYRLTGGLEGMWSTYGRIIAAKLLLFVLLMVLAGANKWILGPAMATGDPVAVRRFRICVALEWMLIAIVLVATAVLTTFYSPG